jgi:hypothetical protein
MLTSPSSHNRFLEEADARAGGKLKYVAQIFKDWRNTRANVVPISGFHAELLLAESGMCEGARSYAAIFSDLLARLSTRGCAALRDPVGISGLIAASGSESKRESAVATVNDASWHAQRALGAERSGDVGEAWRQWNVVFNNLFPR